MILHGFKMKRRFDSARASANAYSNPNSRMITHWPASSHRSADAETLNSSGIAVRPPATIARNTKLVPKYRNARICSTIPSRTPATDRPAAATAASNHPANRIEEPFR